MKTHDQTVSENSTVDVIVLFITHKNTSKNMREMKGGCNGLISGRRGYYLESANWETFTYITLSKRWYEV